MSGEQVGAAVGGLWRSGGGEGGETRDRGERMTGERSAGS